MQNIPKSQRTDGWSGDLTKGNKNKTNSNAMEEERFRNISSGTAETVEIDEDTIPVIPDIDEMQEDLSEDAGVKAKRTSYTEINNDFLKQGSLTTFNDLDLSILAKCLQNENELREPDDVWNWNTIFTDVSAKIGAERIEK